MAVPDAVDDLAAEPDVQRLHFSWTEPANNGSAITKYTLYLDAVEHTDDVTSPHEVANLTGDVLSGPWTITATNGDGGGWEDVVGATSSPSTASGLTSETEYDFRVAYTDDNETIYSNVVNVTTDEEPPVPESISNLGSGNGFGRFSHNKGFN